MFNSKKLMEQNLWFCVRCKKHKLKSEFGIRRDKDTNGGWDYNTVCKECLRNSRLKCEYGITLEDYNKLFDEQNGCCAICGKHQSEFKRPLSVDHDHNTGKVRGLLCTPCNNGLGVYEGWSKQFESEIIRYLISK